MTSMTVRDDYAEFRAARRIASLDGLRAVAISAVVWHHAADLPDPVIGQGPGVILFFILSGFLITTMLVRERLRTGSIAVAPFYLRRSLRIFPLYYAVLVLYIALVLALEHRTPEGRQFFQNLPFYLTFTANLFVDMDGGHRVIFYFAWSLAAQEQFYAYWPWVVRVARSWRFPVAVAVTLLVLGELAGLPGSAPLLPGLLVGRRLLWGGAPILVGCLAAYAAQSPGAFQVMKRIAGHGWSVLLVAALLAVPRYAPGAAHLSIVMALLLLVMTCVVRPDHLLRPFLEYRLVQHIGKVSFGIYLTHMLVLLVVRHVAPGLGTASAFALTMVLAVGVASLSYRYFERPFLRFKNALSREPTGTVPAPPPAITIP